MHYDKPEMLIAPNEAGLFSGNVNALADRIRLRIAELGLVQADVARASGCSTQRFGNYISGRRDPDLETLGRIARALRTTTDWLLGLSEANPADARAIIFRLLELDGMPRERAEVIAQAAEEALRLLASLPPDGNAQDRALLSAQAAWNMKAASTPF